MKRNLFTCWAIFFSTFSASIAFSASTSPSSQSSSSNFISSASALPKTKKTTCQFELACAVAKQEFSLQFTSPSGDCSEDDMILNFKADRTTTEKLALLPPQWYLFTEHISKTQDSICKDISNETSFAAYAIEDKYALLFIKASGRPGLDQLYGMLINPISRKTLDVKALGQSRNQFVAVLKTKKGFKVRAVRGSLSFHKDVSCDCDAPFVDDWLEVQIHDGRLQTHWLNK